MNKTTSFTIGKVTGVHGLDGTLKIWSFADSIDTFCPGKTVLLKSEEDLGKPYVILKAMVYKKGVLLSLDGVDNRTLAEDLIEKEISIDREQLPESPEDTWYWQDLIGLDVVDHTKGIIGKITDIFTTGANDVLVVTDKNRETLVPMQKYFVASIDIEKKIVKTTLPPELLSD